MQDQPSDNSQDFPRTGFRARRWARFERDLHAWLATPEGRFVSWSARRQVDGSGTTQRCAAWQAAHRPLTTTCAWSGAKPAARAAASTPSRSTAASTSATVPQRRQTM